MILAQNNQVTIEIADVGIDFDLYSTMVQFFQASGFYMKSSFILPYHFVDGEVALTVTGQPGVGYRVVAGDLEYDFFGSISINLPAGSLQSRIIDIQVYDTGFSLILGASVAFPYYIVFVYVMSYIILQFFGDLDKIKYGWYLAANNLYPDLLERHFGQLTDVSWEVPWDFNEYREVLMQWVDSFMKYPAIKQGFIQCVNSLQYKDWIEAKLNTWHTSMGYTKMPTIDKWVNEKGP